MFFSLYIDEGIVELFDWPSPREEDWTPYQEKAYNDCIKISAEKTRWLALIDIDEFIVPVQKSNVKDFLKEFDDIPSVGGVKINWQMFGTSWCKKVPADKLMIETLLLKASKKYPSHREVKTICKPHTISLYKVHAGRHKKGYHSVSANGHSGVSRSVEIDRIQLNHYWTKMNTISLMLNFPVVRVVQGRDIKKMKSIK